MYYYCVLKDDNVLDFGKRCNKLKVEDLTSNTVVFLCKGIDKTILLGIVPLSEIKYILLKHIDEEINSILLG